VTELAKYSGIFHVCEIPPSPASCASVKCGVTKDQSGQYFSYKFQWKECLLNGTFSQKACYIVKLEFLIIDSVVTLSDVMTNVNAVHTFINLQKTGKIFNKMFCLQYAVTLLTSTLNNSDQKP